MAVELGITFYEDGGHVDIPSYFHLIEHNPLKTAPMVRYALQGEIDGIDVSIFEFLRYTVGSHSPSRRMWGYAQSVALLVVPGLDLPKFTLRPEKLRHKLGVGTHGTDIDFPEDPTFSRRWLLTGDNEDVVRQFFNDDVRGFFSDRSLRIVQGFANELIYYQPTTTLGRPRFYPGPIREVLDEAQRFIELARR